MATKTAIAILRADSIGAINSAASRIGGLLSIAPLDLPTTGRDPDLLQAQQMSVIAAYLQGLGDALDESMAVSPTPVVKVTTSPRSRAAKDKR
jgi:hypothetical protein